MKTDLRAVWIGLVLAGTMIAGGCVSKAELDAANARNRRMAEERAAALEQAKKLEQANAELARMLQERDGMLKAAQEKIDLLAGENKLLSEKLAELKGQFDELIAGGKLTTGPLPPEMDLALQQLAAENPDLLEYDARHGMVKLKGDMTFAPGSDDVTPNAVKALREFVRIVNKPIAAPYNIYVAGHTDDQPIVQSKVRHPTNWYLSVHRAVSVEKVLSEAGLMETRMGTMGFSEFHSVAPNAPNNKGNVLNRRVELWIVPPDRFLTPGAISAPKARAPAPAPAAPEAPVEPVVPAVE